MTDMFLSNINTIYELIKANIVIIVILSILAFILVVLNIFFTIKEVNIEVAFNGNKPIYFKNNNEVIVISKSNGWIFKDGFFRKDDRLIKLENNSDNLSLNIQ